MKNILIIVIAIIALLVSCEKDDICTTPNADTSHLIIRFYDETDPDTPKVVNNLLIQGVDNPLDYSLSSTDSIAIPLKILENITSFKLTKDYGLIDDSGTPDDTTDDTPIENEDTVIITYENEELFISEACGYKNIFNNVYFGFTGDSSDNWVKTPTVVNNKIENEDNAHVHIFH